MPRRCAAVDLGHLLRLWVAAVLGVVTAAGTRGRAADEGDVGPRPAGRPKPGDLRGGRTADAHAHIEQALAPGLFDVLADVPVLGAAQAELVEVRAPHQPADV